MASPIWSYLFGAFLFVHGLGHFAGLSMGPRAFGALWPLGAAGFVGAGLAFFRLGLPHAWWLPLTVGAAAVSTLLILIFVPAPGPKLNALIANVGILFAVLWWHWPAPLKGT